VADAGLVVAVVGAPEAHELAQQVGLFVVVLGRADEVDRIRAAGFASALHLGGDFVERLVPADALVLAVDQLHRVAQAVFAVAVLAQGAPLAQWAPRLMGESNTGSWRTHTPFSTMASVAQPTEQWVQTVRLTSILPVPSMEPPASGLGLFDQRQLRGGQPTPTPRPERRRNGGQRRRSMVGSGRGLLMHVSWLNMARSAQSERLRTFCISGIYPRTPGLTSAFALCLGPHPGPPGTTQSAHRPRRRRAP
jgi:hypothetical protein